MNTVQVHERMITSDRDRPVLRGKKEKNRRLKNT